MLDIKCIDDYTWPSTNLVDLVQLEINNGYVLLNIETPPTGVFQAWLIRK